MPTIPDEDPLLWATSEDAVIETPSEELQENGYAEGDEPAAKHFNAIFKNQFQRLKFLEEGGGIGSVSYYATIAALKAVNTTDALTLSKFFIPDMGVYIFISGATAFTDNEYQFPPTTGPGGYFLILPHPNFTYSIIEPYVSELEDRMQTQIDALSARISALE